MSSELARSLTLSSVRGVSFGALSGRSVSLPSAPMVVLFGRNESGKSTVLTAMRWCIGGPQVDPSLLGRFGDYGAKVEAVASGYFGGRPLSSTVRLNVPKKRSPARKGLFVDWDDAQVSGEWHEMLGGIDAESFAQIYSMSGEQLHLGGDIESVVSRLMHSASGTNFDPMERAAALREAARGLSGRRSVGARSVKALNSAFREVNDRYLAAARNVDDYRRVQHDLERLDHELSSWRKERVAADAEVGRRQRLREVVEADGRVARCRARLGAAEPGSERWLRLLESEVDPEVLLEAAEEIAAVDASTPVVLASTNAACLSEEHLRKLESAADAVGAAELGVQSADAEVSRRQSAWAHNDGELARHVGQLTSMIELMPTVLPTRALDASAFAAVEAASARYQRHLTAELDTSLRFYSGREGPQSGISARWAAVLAASGAILVLFAVAGAMFSVDESATRIMLVVVAALLIGATAMAAVAARLARAGHPPTRLSPGSDTPVGPNESDPDRPDARAGLAGTLRSLGIPAPGDLVASSAVARSWSDLGTAAERAEVAQAELASARAGRDAAHEVLGAARNAWLNELSRFGLDQDIERDAALVAARSLIRAQDALTAWEQRKDALAPRRRRWDPLLAPLGRTLGDWSPSDAAEHRRRLAKFREAAGVAADLAQAEDDLRRQVIAAGGPALSATSAVVSLDLAEVEAQIAEAVEAREQLDERIGRAQEERARLVHRLDELSTVEQLVELGVDLESIRAQRSDLARRAVVLALCAEAIETAGRRFEQRTQPEVLKRAGAHIRSVIPEVDGLIARRRRGVTDSVELALSYQHGGELVVNRLSAGARAVVYFAIRLGLIEHDASQRGVRLPILLDEPFAHLDDQRWELAFDLVAAADTGHQVVLSSCSERIAERAASIGVPVVAIDPTADAATVAGPPQ